MVGAVIGDLAEWTWEHDRECLYKQLVSPRAKLTGYGLLPIVMWPMINEGGIILKHRLYMVCGKALAHCRAAGVDIPEDWHRWGLEDFDKGIPFELKVALIMSAIIDGGYLSEERQNQLDWDSFFHGGKQEGYAMQMMRILRRLNEGATKDEAIEDIPKPVINFYPSGETHPWENLLEYVTFAWRCFYYSWDFTSALHNAAKCPANRHLAMMLTGAFAEAMYGCRHSMIKQKFGGIYDYISFPDTIASQYRKTLEEVRRYDYDHRHFFKKNDALSNVERHHWTNEENPLADFPVNSELRRRMMKAFETGYEHRYGVYLDNGWFYIYRSHCILHRYQLKQVSDGEWRICNLQKSNDPHGQIEDLTGVIGSLESWWYANMGDYTFPVSNEDGPENIRYCKYYRGETQCPARYKDKVEGKFWYGEKMFLDTNQSLKHWMDYGVTIKQELSGDKKDFSESYSLETFGIIMYIESLFSKWCPYDTMEWIYKY